MTLEGVSTEVAEALGGIHPASGWPSQQRARRIAEEAGDNTPVVDESSRLAGRAHWKREVVKARLAEHRHSVVQQLIAQLNLDKMRAADQHGADCEPLRQELASLDSEQVANVLAGGEMDATLEARRRELLDAIEANNKALAIAIEAADERIEVLESERRTLAKLANREQYERELFRLGNPALIERMHEVRRRGGVDMDGNTVQSIYDQIVNE